MRQVTTIIISIFVVVYLTLMIFNRPNFEFFSVDNQLPGEPKFVKTEFKNGGIEVTWTHPSITNGLTHYEIYVEDIRDSNNKIQPIIVSDQNSANKPKFMVRDKTILPDKQYRVSMKSVNNNGKSIVSNINTTAIARNTASNTSISSGTNRALDAETERFRLQESEQNIQNRAISELKKRVDILRNDIVIMKNKEKEENRSIYNQVDMEDSISQLPGSVRDRYGLNLPGEIDFNFTIDPTL